MAEKPNAALFVRIPQAQARALDRLAFETRRPKQAVVSELLSRAIGEPALSRALGEPTGGKPALSRAIGEPTGRRVTIETVQEPATVVGRHAFRAFEPDVLTLEEVAELLAVAPAAVAELAASGELPGRRIGEHWRFARTAVLGWLAHGAAGLAVPDHAED